MHDESARYEHASFRGVGHRRGGLSFDVDRRLRCHFDSDRKPRAIVGVIFVAPALLLGACEPSAITARPSPKAARLGQPQSKVAAATPPQRPIRFQTKQTYINVTAPLSRTPDEWIRYVPAMLKEAGYAPTDDREARDSVSLQLTGTALSAYYGRKTGYTGAKYSVRLEAMLHGTRHATRFQCDSQPPFLYQAPFLPTRPEDAPFNETLAECSELWWRVSELVRDHAGADAAVRAAFRAPRHSGVVLAKHGTAAVPALLERLLSVEDDAPIVALEYFAIVRDERSVEPLLRFRSKLVSAETGERDDAEIIRIRRLRHMTVTALGHQRDRRATSALLEELSDCKKAHYSHLCSFGMPALGELGDPAAVDQIADVLLDTSVGWPERVAAAEALGNIGGRNAVAVLRRTVHDKERMVRGATENALMKARRHYDQPDESGSQRR